MDASGLIRFRNIIAGYALASIITTVTFFLFARKFSFQTEEYEYEMPLIILLFFVLSFVFTIVTIILSFEAFAEKRGKNSKISLKLDG